MHIEDLSGLSKGAEKRVVASLALLLAIEADRRALGKTAGRQHRAIEVQRHRGQLQGQQAIKHQISQQFLQFVHRLTISPGQGATDGGHIRHTFETDRSLDNWVVGVKPHLTQMAKAQNEMHNQKQHNPTTTEDRSYGLVAKAVAQLLAQINDIEKLLEEQQSGEGCKLLVLKLQRWQAMGFLNSFSFAILHLKRPSVCVFWYWFCRHQMISQRSGRFLFARGYAR